MPVQAAPYTPASDAVVIERLPFRAGDSTARELAALRSQVEREPFDQASAVELAQRYFDLAMARGDPRYVGYANALVARFSEPLAAPMLLVRGTLRQYRHDFEDALEDFAKALREDPDLAGAHAWRGAIFLVTADYTSAERECAALRQLQRAVLAGGCNGLLLAYTGQTDKAYQTLQTALVAASNDEHRLWLHTRIGEVSVWTGQPALAERHFRRALAIGRDDGYLLAAWCDFLLDLGRPAEVVTQLAGWESSDGLLLRLTEAESRLKLPTAAVHQQALADRFAAAKLRGDTTHRAEEARFHLRLLGDAPGALALARANYQVQKEPRDARILLEAALAVQNADAARAALDWLHTSGFEDARLRQLGKQLTELAPARTPKEGRP
jgi:Tfp pilus assembly protein PilF